MVYRVGREGFTIEDLKGLEENEKEELKEQTQACSKGASGELRRSCGCGSVSGSKSKLVRKGPGPEDLVFTLSEIKSIRGLE